MDQPITIDEMASDAAVFPDGHRVAIGYQDGTLAIWDTIARKKLDKAQAHSGGVTRVVASPDGEHIATSGTDGSVKLWQIRTTRSEKSLASRFGVGPTKSNPFLSFSSDGSRLAGWQQNESAMCVLNVKTEQVVELPIPIGEVIRCGRFALGEMLVTGLSSGGVLVWDDPIASQVATYKGHTAPIFDMQIRHCGNRVATASYDKTVRLQTLGGERDVVTIDSGTVCGVRFLPFANEIAIASERWWGVKFWDERSGKEVRSYGGEDPEPGGFLELSADGRIVVTGGTYHQHGGGFVARKIASGAVVGRSNTESPIRRVLVAPRATWIITLEKLNGRLRLWALPDEI